MMLIYVNMDTRLRSYFDDDEDEENDESDDEDDGIKLNTSQLKPKKDEIQDRSFSEEDSTSESVEKLKQIKAFMEHARVLEKLGDIAAADAAYERALSLVILHYFIYLFFFI